MIDSLFVANASVEWSGSRRIAPKQLCANVSVRYLLDALPAYIAIIAPDGTLLEINRTLEDFTGLRAEVLLGKQILKFLNFLGPSGVGEAVRAGLSRASAGETVRCDGVIRTRQGQDIPLDLTFCPVIDKVGVVEMIVVTGVDVSQRARMHEQLLELQDKLAHVLRRATADDLAAGIAHELKQPLTAIQNYGHALGSILKLNEAAIESRMHEIVRSIGEQVQRASEMITGLRELFRKGGSRRSEQNLNDIVRRAVNMALVDGGNRRCVIQTCLACDLPAVVVDPIQIEQVVVNLVRNAIEALEVTTAPYPYVRVEVIRFSYEQAVVRVIDNGPGFEPDAAEVVFDAFYTTKPTGLGMGLAISRSIVEAHGGRLCAKSTPWHQTVVQFSLPLVGQPNSSCRKV
jgi:PAS domain S-box-containing protein